MSVPPAVVVGQEAGPVAQQYLWGCADEAEAGKAPGISASSPEGPRLGGHRAGPEKASDGVRPPSGPGEQSPHPLALSTWTLRGPGSVVRPQPVTRPSSSLRGRPQRLDGVQVPHHHPRRVDGHREVGCNMEATDDVARVDVLGLRGGPSPAPL